MQGTADLAAPCQRLSPPEGHYFFGYYDLPAAEAQGRHLCLRVPFRERFPRPGETAILGWLPLPETPASREAELGTFQPFAETAAWNFQQACMLQWLPEPDTCLYNVFIEGTFGCCVHNLRTGTRRCLSLPVANVSSDGKKALCVNMARIYDFRPGYGYEEIPDPYAAELAPEEDGVFLMDLTTGAYRLLVSLAETVDFLAVHGENVVGQKVVINHITFNPSGDRYLFLLRNIPPRDSRWETWLLTADSAGGGLHYHKCYGMASHYHWRDNEHVLFYMNIAPQQAALVLLNVRTDERELINPQLFTHDGHCSYSPNRKWILYDSYVGPAPDYFRTLYVYSVEADRLDVLGRFRAESYTWENIDLRCDLHPRWMPGGKAISFDSIHEGYRGLYWMDLRAIVD